jgi:hypothetical protein
VHFAEVLRNYSLGIARPLSFVGAFGISMAFQSHQDAWGFHRRVPCNTLNVGGVSCWPYRVVEHACCLVGGQVRIHPASSFFYFLL